jgi:hypothetical protein
VKPGGPITAARRGALGTLTALVLIAALAGGPARGEQAQKGNVVISLDGGLSPLALPRDRAAPISVHLEAGLRTSNRAPLPRVGKVELSLAGRGVITSRGLPTCSLRRLRDTLTDQALSNCGGALVGRGRMLAQVQLPLQRPFMVDTRLLAFNALVHGSPAVILHAVSARPPTSVILPFVIHPRRGRLGTALVAHLSRSLGPWPRFARFEVTLWRRYSYRGQRRSYLSASCPAARRSPTGFFTLARARFTLTDGRNLTTSITRSCRAR